MLLIIHRIIPGLHPYWKGDAVVTFQWALVVKSPFARARQDLVSKQCAYRLESVRT